MPLRIFLSGLLLLTALGLGLIGYQVTRPSPLVERIIQLSAVRRALARLPPGRIIALTWPGGRSGRPRREAAAGLA